MKHFPNILSCLRIVMSVLLLLLIDFPFFFVAGYFLCGITDVADGYIARKYKVETKLGSQLDSLGDSVFLAVVLYLLFFHGSINIDDTILLGVIIILIARAINIMITKLRFNEWSIMHSIGNKIAGVLTFIVVPICFVIGDIPLLIGMPVLLVALLSAIEECVILFTSTNYDANKKSIFESFLQKSNQTKE